MKYFPQPTYDDQHHQGIIKLTEQASQLITEICKNLKLPLEALHISLWIFHCYSKIMTFRNFDRFLYLCAAILFGSKISEHIRNPQDILHQLRSIIKKRKNIIKQDCPEIIKKLLKKIFQAQINLMINIGFDFQIDLSLYYLNNYLKNQIKDINLIDKIKQTLTSFYKTYLVLYFNSQIIALTALDIVMKNQGISIELSQFSQNLIKKLKKDQIKSVKTFFINKCSII